MKRPLVFMTLLAAGAFGCEGGTVDPSLGERAPAASASAAAAEEKSQEEAQSGAQFIEADFVESDEARDPFRDYTSLFKKPTDDILAVNQRKVKAAQYSLDELKLVGLISGAKGRALLDDATGFGWVVYTGDFVGRAEFVSTGGTDAQEIAINWRVDRIRPTDIVFVREDVSHPEIPPTTRVVPLYEAGESRGGS